MMTWYDRVSHCSTLGGHFSTWQTLGRIEMRLLSHSFSCYWDRGWLPTAGGHRE